MKRFVTTTLIATLGLAAPAVALAQADHAAHHGGASAPAAADAPLADGTVKKIDKSAGKLTIVHGPLETLGMPAMTMVFRVKDAAWLDQVKAGDKVRFMADQINGAMTVVHLERN